MKIDDVRAKAFAMPLHNPAFPAGPYKFYNREYVVLTYRTDPARLKAVVPEPLEVIGDTVNYEFIRMPDSTGFGDYTETGQVIPVSFRGRKGGYTHCMSLMTRDRLLEAGSSGAFPRSSPVRHSTLRLIPSSARSTMGQFASPRGQWAINTRGRTRTLLKPRSPRRTSF